MADRKPPAKAGLLGRLLGGRDAAKARKGMPLPKKKIWRISERSPAGEWVDADSISSVPPPAPAPTQPAELSGAGWLTSSMDLLGGTEIVEEPDTQPAALDDPSPRTLPLPRKKS